LISFELFVAGKRFVFKIFFLFSVSFHSPHLNNFSLNLKWKEGDPIPECSWREFYRLNPCVPVDYPTLPAALEATCPQKAASARERKSEDLPSRTIWLRSQEHRLEEVLVVEAVQANITLETMQTTPKKRRQSQALLVFQTRRRNKPLVHIAAGHVTLRNLKLNHYCGGFNLWNGNAAVQIQPITPPETEAPLLPTASLEHVEITSHSGRGVVVNDGGDVTIEHSLLHGCAATGVYCGSLACVLTMEHSDIIANGYGNQLAASVRTTGVTRGHSGIYLENGDATLRECNVSNNSSCGISVSSAASRLTLDHSDVVANGHVNQVDLATGSQQLGSHNSIARTGTVRVRSRLGLECCGGGGNGARSRTSSSGSFSGNEDNISSHGEDAEEEVEDEFHDSFVVADANVRFGDLVEI
jgi:hypothetical protein